MEKQDKCFNTLEHGSIWGIELSGWPEINWLAQKDGFLKSRIIYMGNILTYDTDKVYSFFRDEVNNKNYLMRII